MSEGCSAVKRFGESCPKNNNCKYPQCLIDEHTEAWKGLEEENKALQKKLEKLEKQKAAALSYANYRKEHSRNMKAIIDLLNKDH